MYEALPLNSELWEEVEEVEENGTVWRETAD